MIHWVTRDSLSHKGLFLGTPLIDFVSSTLEMLNFETEGLLRVVPSPSTKTNAGGKTKVYATIEP